MSKKSNKRRPKREPAGKAAAQLAEARVTDFITTGWLLTVFTTLLCELGGVATLWWARVQPELLPMAVLSSMLLFAAAVTGVMGLVLFAVVWKLRKIKPPKGVAVFSLVVSTIPLLALVVQASMK